MEPSWDGGTKVFFLNGPGHMIKMAATPIYMVKILKKNLLQNEKADDFESWYAALSARVLTSLFK